RKLAAYLHDPPSKALDIRTHGERSDATFAQAGFSDTEIGEYFTHADHTAAAMDRLPFPKFSAGLQCAFDGVRNGCLHPLSGEKMPFHAEFPSVEQVFAIVTKPLVITGWSLPDEAGANDSERSGGAQSTHFVVPAGAIHYFEAEPDANGGPGNAIALAAALNWHGSGDGTEIKNRRSTLLGEEGFGLDVCGTWNFYP
ncbi:MAG: hypothetical protein O2960_29215, partial [Verrucomicrobia bacterium]|nr:hypothetical protein [Verrucomicrobiota bacterium]